MENEEYQRMWAAEDNHWWYVGLHDLIVAIVREETRLQGRPIEIFDVGCGTGRLCQLLSLLGNVTACDLHPAAVRATAERGITRVFAADIGREELGHECFDVITAIDVLYHRSVADESLALAHLHQALRPGGKLILQVAAFELLRGSHDVAVHTRRRYRLPEMIQLLQSAGFDVTMATYRLAILLPPTLLWRLSSRLFLKGSTNQHVRSDLAASLGTPLNRILALGVKFENRLLMSGLRLPFGTSVFVVARK